MRTTSKSDTPKEYGRQWFNNEIWRLYCKEINLRFNAVRSCNTKTKMCKTQLKRMGFLPLKTFYTALRTALTDTQQNFEYTSF